MQVDTPHTQAHHSFLVTLCPGHHQLSWAPYHPSRVSPNPEGLCFKLCVLFVCHESFPVSNQHDSRGSDSLRKLPLCEEPLLTGLTLRNLGVRAGFRARDSEGAAGKCLQLWRQVLCGVVEPGGKHESNLQKQANPLNNKQGPVTNHPDSFIEHHTLATETRVFKSPTPLGVPVPLGGPGAGAPEVRAGLPPHMIIFGWGV